MGNSTGRPDYYEILGVPRLATPEQIAAAFRGRACQCHPDVCPGAGESAEHFKLIAEAYEVLGDREKRRQYDRGLNRAPQGPSPARPRTHRPSEASGGPQPGDLLDLLHQMVGAPRASAGERPTEPRWASAAQGVDIQAELPLNVDEARRGGPVTFWLSFQDDCPSCGGTPTGCATCSDSGSVRRRPRPVTVHIPPGLWAGSVLRVAGAGKSVGTGPPGDLVLRVRVQPC